MGSVSVGSYRSKNDVLGSILLSARCLFHIGLIFGAIVSFRSSNYFYAGAAALFNFLFYSFFGWAGIGHELSHGTVFTNPKVNNFFYVLFSALVWGNYVFFKVSHSVHHRKTLSSEDVESNAKIGIPSNHLLLLCSFDFVSFYRKVKILLINAFGIVPIHVEKLFPVGSDSRKRLVFAARSVLVFHILLLVIFISLGLPELVFLVSLAPFFFSILNRLLAVAQHFGVEVEDENDYFRNSRTIILNPCLSFFYANMNYHVEHHLYPGVPYYRLSALHRELKVEAQYHHYCDGFLSMVSELKRLGCFVNRGKKL